MKCTWKDCNKEGSIPQLDTSKKQWAFLCQEHHDEIESSISSKPFNPKRLLSVWIKAQGGAKAVSERLL